MNRQRFTDGDRSRIALGWRGSGMTQPAYAAMHSISDRALRAWLARFAPSCRNPDEGARLVLKNALEQLQALLRALDAVPAGHPDPDPEPPSPSPAAPVCQPVVESKTASDGLSVHLPMPSRQVPADEPARQPFSWA